MDWINENEQYASNNLGELIQNKVPFIRLKNFISTEDANLLLEQLELIGFDFYKNVSPPIGKLGVTVFENQDSPLNYFKKSREILSNIKNSAPKHQKLLGKLVQLFGAYGFSIFSENVDYFAGLIRIMKGGALLHIDYAPFDSEKYSINKIETQIACNIFLKTPKQGGELVVHNKKWQLEDEKLKKANSYGYNKKIVDNVELAKIKPEVGDLILFNSRNYHKVLPNGNLDENRITFSCFAGINKNNECQIWS